MSLIQLYTIVSKYSLDILIIALIVSLISNLLKKTLLKTLKNKYYTFLPFVLSAILYFVYVIIFNGGIDFVKENYSTIIENTITIGCISTFYYVIFEQFIRSGKVGSLVDYIKPFLLNIVLEENIDSTAEKLFTLFCNNKDLFLTDSIEVLKENVSKEITQDEIVFSSKIIFTALEKMK